MIKFRISARAEQAPRDDFRLIFEQSVRDLALECERESVERLKSNVRHQAGHCEQRVRSAANHSQFDECSYGSSVAWLEARARFNNVGAAKPMALALRSTAHTEEAHELESARVRRRARYLRSHRAIFKKSPPRAPRTVDSER